MYRLVMKIVENVRLDQQQDWTSYVVSFFFFFDFKQLVRINSVENRIRRFSLTIIGSRTADSGLCHHGPKPEDDRNKARAVTYGLFKLQLKLNCTLRT